MDPLKNLVGDLSQKVAGLSGAMRFLVLGGAAAVVAAAVFLGINGAPGTYQYAFTNLTAEDSGEAVAQLKAAGIPSRVEAGGSALAVPASQVYDARLLLAASGLPRGGGVGFEIFDRGDLGVSEFTQRVNLRRALEGELSRTVGRLSAIRSARVHITLPEKGLYRDEDRKAAAAVVVNLQPGRALADKEVMGVRHLVASAVAGLDAQAVTIVDGHGAVLAGSDSAGARAATEQQDIERALEGRVSDLLGAAVGQGAVVARVTAALDASEIETTSDVYDPETTAVRSERRTNEATSQDSNGPAGLAGAAANQPLAPAAGGGAGAGKGSTTREDEVKNYEVSKTVTRSVTRGPRIKRLSVAVLVDGIDGKPRLAAELVKLGDLAKSAVGFDAARGDKLEISSAPFSRRADTGDAGAGAALADPRIKYGAIGAGVLVALVLLALVLKRGKRSATSQAVALLTPGSRVSDLEAVMARPMAALPPGSSAAAAQLADPNMAMRERAREIATADPARAAHILKAWIQTDGDKVGAS